MNIIYEGDDVSLFNDTQSKAPTLFSRKLINEIKNKILGKRFNVSFVFVSPKKIQGLNKKYRKIDKPTDVLSFNVEKNIGEIYICKSVADKKSVDFKHFYSNYYLYLVIHSLLHLKGFEHSVKMEKVEKKLYDFFS